MAGKQARKAGQASRPGKQARKAGQASLRAQRSLEQGRISSNVTLTEYRSVLAATKRSTRHPFNRQQPACPHSTPNPTRAHNQVQQVQQPPPPLRPTRLPPGWTLVWRLQKGRRRGAGWEARRAYRIRRSTSLPRYVRTRRYGVVARFSVLIGEGKERKRKGKKRREKKSSTLTVAFPLSWPFIRLTPRIWAYIDPDMLTCMRRCSTSHALGIQSWSSTCARVCLAT